MQDVKFPAPTLVLLLITCITFSCGCTKQAPPAEPSGTPLAITGASHKTNDANAGFRAERIMVNLTNTPGMQTLKGFTWNKPYPWPDGNWSVFHFRITNAPTEIETWASWSVINIYSENLHEITRRLDTKTVEMLILPITNYQSTMQDAGGAERPILQQNAYALVCDPRIPRDWFVFTPINTRENARQIKAAYPECFSAEE